MHTFAFGGTETPPMGWVGFTNGKRPGVLALEKRGVAITEHGVELTKRKHHR